MTDEATITLVAGQYEALDGVHCGVSKFGQVTVAGDVTTLEDGQSHVLARTHIEVSRSDEEYAFKAAN